MAHRILMVDDDEGFRLAAGSLLEAEGYEVAAAVDARDARAQLEANTPDLVLLDVIMPGEDGFTLAESLKDDPAFANLPVVLITSVADNPGQMMRAFEQGKGCTVANILPKGEAHANLVKVVDSILAKT